MANDVEGSPVPEWLVEPPGAGEVFLYVAAGEGVQLSDDAKVALEALMRELQSSEVEGFRRGPDCPSYDDCLPYSCTLANCHPQYRKNCLVDAGCKIANIF